MTAPGSLAQQQSLASGLERLRPGLRIIALRALGDPDAAEEAVQETLARAVIAIGAGKLDNPEKLGAYVAGIARHICAHIHRDRKSTVALDERGAIGEPQLAVAHDPLAALIREDEGARLRAALRELSTDDQRLLRLCFHDEQSPAQLAATLHEPPERIRKRKSRALDRLRRAFLGEPDGHNKSGNGTISTSRTPSTMNAEETS